MRLGAAAGLTLLCALGTWAAGPKGTVPRSEASRYPAHGGRGGVWLGAVLLPPEQVKRNFVSDLNRCCVVVEVAIYPEAGKKLEVSAADFALRLTGTETAVKAGSPKTLAATLQKAGAGDRNITLYPQAGVGYESGRTRDPVTGERRSDGGVVVSAGVGVGVGEPSPATTDKDREVMETELAEKGLPEGASSSPVAGYLYFPLTAKKKGATYQLEYTVNGSKITLRLP